VIVAVLVMPRWAADLRFQVRHEFAVIFGTMLGTMAIMFIAFIDAAPMDLYFKVVVDIFAVALMIALGFKIKDQSAPWEPRFGGTADGNAKRTMKS